MSRHAFWTILVDGSPTAFRAPLREDLQPTLVQLQRTHPDAVIRWFEKGQLWETPGHAQDAAKAKRDAERPKRGASWRPGGDHKDPRDKYKVPRDVKRKRWASQAADGRGPWVKGRTEEGKKGRTEEGRRDARPPSGGRKAPFTREGGPGGPRPTGGQRPRSAGDRRPPSGERRPSSGDRRPLSTSARPPRSGAGASRPPSTGRPPRPPGTPSAPPSAASAKRKPNVYKAGEMPPKQKKRDEDE